MWGLIGGARLSSYKVICCPPQPRFAFLFFPFSLGTTFPPVRLVDHHRVSRCHHGRWQHLPHLRRRRHWRRPVWFRHLLAVGHHQHRAISLLLQRGRRPAQRRLRWSFCQCPGRRDRRHGRRLMGRRSGLGLPLRHSRPEEVHYDWCSHLVHWIHDSLRLAEHS